jgi:hypothetical protein
MLNREACWRSRISVIEKENFPSNRGRCRRTRSDIIENLIDNNNEEHEEVSSERISRSERAQSNNSTKQYDGSALVLQFYTGAHY